MVENKDLELGGMWSKNNTALKAAQGHFFKRNKNNQVGERQHCCIVKMATGPHMTRS